MTGLQTGGYIALGVGLAFAGVGTALLVVDALAADESVEVSGPELLFLPSLTGGTALVRF